MIPGDYDFLAAYLRARSGLAITRARADLVERRLVPVAARHGFRDVGGLIGCLRAGDEARGRDVIDAMTTHDTSFFREPLIFEAFRDTMLPSLMQTRRKERRLRIWSAGCSTGQEPYSLAMMLDDVSRLSDWKIEIVASDINKDVLERARAGVYEPFEVQRGLTVPMLARHFRRDGQVWRISDAAKSRIEFCLFNLLQPFEGLGRFDIVFCRNALMYFAREVKEDVLARLSAIAASDGYLVLGAAETAPVLANGFSPMEGAPGVFTRAPKREFLRAAIG